MKNTFSELTASINLRIQPVTFPFEYIGGDQLSVKELDDFSLNPGGKTPVGAFFEKFKIFKA